MEPSGEKNQFQDHKWLQRRNYGRENCEIPGCGGEKLPGVCLCHWGDEKCVYQGCQIKCNLYSAGSFLWSSGNCPCTGAWWHYGSEWKYGHRNTCCIYCICSWNFWTNSEACRNFVPVHFCSGKYWAGDLPSGREAPGGRLPRGSGKVWRFLWSPQGELGTH